MNVDNFEAIRSRLKFDKPGDFFVAHVMFRVKDLREEADRNYYICHEDTTRLIKTFYVDSLEYFDKKTPVMKDLAERNRARIYIELNRKNRLVINRVLAKKLIDFIDDPNVRYDHIIRSAVCGCHISDYRWWVLDIDPDTKVEYLISGMPSCRLIECREFLIEKMKKLVDETKTRSGSEIFEVPTKNGYHILTPPFNKSILSFLGDNLKTDASTLLYYNGD